MSDLKLTQKQEKFVIQYFKTGNATQSAITAGYSPKTAQVIAAENLTKPMIVERLTQLRQKVEDAAVMTKLEILKRHSEFARTNLTDFMELGQDGSWVNIGKETPNAGAIAEIHSRTEYDEDGAHPTVYTSVKLCDRQKSMSEICKILGFYQQPDMPIEDNRQVNFIFVLPDGTRIAPSKLTGNNTQKQLLPPGGR